MAIFWMRSHTFFVSTTSLVGDDRLLVVTVRCYKASFYSRKFESFYTFFNAIGELFKNLWQIF